MLQVWGAPNSRPTRDIDLLGFLDNEIESLEAIVKELCEMESVIDGLRFDSTTIVGMRIKEDGDYEGVRIKFTGFLEKSRIPMQLDVGFGDVVHPEAQERDYPTLLDLPAPRLRMYPPETVVAEKLEAIVYLGTLNSRMKDFFDIWFIARQFDFQGVELACAIEKTFKNRKAKLDTEPVALTPEFMASKKSQTMWAAFVRRSMLTGAPETLESIREPLRQFLLPVMAALAQGQAFDAQWTAPGPWVDASGERRK